MAKMPMYKTPPDSPVNSRPQSRSSSRSRSPSPRPKSRSKSKSNSRPEPNARSRSRARSTARDRDRDRGRSRSISSSRSRSSSLDRRKSKPKKYYSGRANEEKIDTSKASVAKTSAIFLGSVAVATVCAHKFWPKGFIYGEKEAWEVEKKEKKAIEKEKKAIREEERADDMRRGDCGGGTMMTTASQSTRDLVYRDRPEQRTGCRGVARPVASGGKGIVISREEEEAVLYRDNRATGRNGIVIRSQEEEASVYRDRDDRDRGRVRGQNGPRLGLPGEEDVAYENTTRLVRERGRDTAGRNLDYDRYLKVADGLPPRRSRSATGPPSPTTTTTMAVAGSPIGVTDNRHQQLQIQQRRDQDYEEDYYLLPAAPQRQTTTIERSNSFSTAPISRDRRRDRSETVERSWAPAQSQSRSRPQASTTKYYTQDEARAASPPRKAEAVYVYRDREVTQPPPPQTRSSRSQLVVVGDLSSKGGRSRYDDERDVDVVDTYYEYR